MKINIVARKRLEINILTRHKLPDHPPPHSPAESNGRPLNFVVNVFAVRTNKKGEVHFDTLNAYFIFAQYLAILHLSKKGVTQKIRRGPDMECLCLHIKKRGRITSTR